MRSFVNRLSRTAKYLLIGVPLIMATSLSAGSGLYNFTLNSIDGKPTPLAEYKGKVVMIVNVASKCGYTPQYSALESTYEKYKDQGFVILGFPANNFGAQEPGTNEEIKTFCTRKYNVYVPDVRQDFGEGRGPGSAVFLPHERRGRVGGGDIKWNFTSSWWTATATSYSASSQPSRRIPRKCPRQLKRR